MIVIALIEEMERLHEDANKPLATTTWHGARGTFQPCSLLAVVSNMSLVTVLVMVYLRLDFNQRVYLRRLDSNLLVLISL
jgi:hypothetical protein